MEQRTNNILKTAVLAGLFGLGLAAATATPALADDDDRRYVQCDRDGDRCTRVVCDEDGDRCRRVETYRPYSYNRYGYYGNGYGYYRHGRRWVCDEDGDRCHWTYDND